MCNIVGVQNADSMFALGLFIRFVYIVCLSSARYIYWASQDIPDNPTERINNIEFLYERQFHPNVGNAVMATSYALLCYLAHSSDRDRQDSVPIMKFITSQRNHLMGWSSTSVRSLIIFVSPTSSLCRV